MITVKQHEKLIDKISRLSELELDDLLKDIGLHLRKNNLEHLINNAFVIDDFEGEIDELNEKLEEKEEKIEDLESDKQNLEVKIEDAIDELEGLEYDGEDSLTDKSKVKDIIKSLQS